jgi:hypothetical protein
MVLPALGASACGSTGGGSTTTISAAALREQDGDHDNDSLGMGHDDGDGDSAPTFAKPATATDRAAIVALIDRYYAAAAAGDWTQACSLTYWLLAETLVEEHSHGKGPPSLRGHTCAQVASKLLAGRRHELIAERAALKIVVVQARANKGWAVLSFGGARERVLYLHHEGAGWRVNGLLDNGPL